MTMTMTKQAKRALYAATVARATRTLRAAFGALPPVYDVCRWDAEAGSLVCLIRTCDPVGAARRLDPTGDLRLSFVLAQ